MIRIGLCLFYMGKNDYFGFSPIKCQPLKNQKIIFYSLNAVSQNVWVLYAKIFVQIFVKSIRNLFSCMTFFRKSCWDSRFSKVCWEKRCHKAGEILDKDVRKEFLTAKSFFRLKENVMGCFLIIFAPIHTVEHGYVQITLIPIKFLSTLW